MILIYDEAKISLRKNGPKTSKQDKLVIDFDIQMFMI